jgi:FOG: CheY-like receiver
MPEMDGIEVLHEIKAKNMVPENTVIIALTANAITGVREMYLGEGFDDYISKPIDISELEHILMKYIPVEKQQSMISGDSSSSQKLSPEHLNATRNFADDKSDKLNYNTDNGKKESVTKSDIYEPVIDEDSFTEKEIEEFNKHCPEINFENAMTYCMNSRTFYYEILKSYIDDDKSETLNTAKENSDYEMYRITVHSIKSMSRTIGADKVSKDAEALEKAVKTGDLDYVKSQHDSLIAEYRKCLDNIRSLSEFANG